LIREERKGREKLRRDSGRWLSEKSGEGERRSQEGAEGGGRATLWLREGREIEMKKKG
jgi:hypothetical protein